MSEGGKSADLNATCYVTSFGREEVKNTVVIRDKTIELSKRHIGFSGSGIDEEVVSLVNFAMNAGFQVIPPSSEYDSV